MDAPHVYVRAWALGCLYSHISTRTFRRALTASVDNCAESAPSVGGCPHTPSIAFWHIPPNSARFSYAIKGALFISAQLSSDAVSTLRMVWVLRLWKQHSARTRR